MNLNSLEKIAAKKKKRTGTGHGSGRGKTAGRGTKGQKARNSVPLDFEGGALPLTKRLPFLRGKGRNKPLTKGAFAVNVGLLNSFSKNSVVDVENLVKAKLVDPSYARAYGVKILGDGDLQVALTVKLPVSKGALKKIEKAGGKVENSKN
jgi:large subunit ribosomal protein L15